jgi:hypothetical protein
VPARRHAPATWLDDILAIVLDPVVNDDQVGGRLRRDVGHDRMRAAHEARRERLPRDHGHLAMMDASMSYLRQFVPDVLAAVEFAGGPGMDDLLQAVGVLAGLHARKARKVPDGAPDSFAPARWAGYLEKASKNGDVTAYRHYWELCVLMALRGELARMLPRVPIASVLVEIDARAGFTDLLTHAGGMATRPPDLRRNLLYVLIAEATNMDLSAMAESCGVSTTRSRGRPSGTSARRRSRRPTPRSSTTTTGCR